MHTQFDVSNRSVCIAGASRGLGKAVARAFAQAGARVVIGSWDEEDLARTREEFERLSLTLQTCTVDVSSRDDCRRLVEQTVSVHGSIDVMICNAGVDVIKPAESYEQAEWDRILDINLRGAYYCAQFAAQQRLPKGKGSIIMTSSVAGTHGIPGLVPYAASKGGIDQLVRTMAVEWAQSGVRVNAVAPGFIDNIMAGVTFDPDDAYQKRAIARTPMGRRGALHEFVGAYLYLASDAASYVTGAILYVDGGFHAG
jgi:NAD(P)-dependent dehydrogenase (short-subunit alcohol dehydrogenase family)